MGFLSEFEAIAGAAGAKAEEIGPKLFQLVNNWLIHHGDDFFDELRRFAPIFVPPGPLPVIISRYADVVEVAGLNDIFGTQPYGETNRIVNGGANFLLGMENTPQYEFEKSALKLAFRRTDLDRIRAIDAAEASKILGACGDSGSLEIVEGYARKAPNAVAAEYFGVPGPDNGKTMPNWIRAMFTELFVNFTKDPKIAEAGAEAGRQFRAYLDGLIAQAQASGNGSDTALARLLSMKGQGTTLSVDRIRDNLTGLLVGMYDNTTMAVCNVIDILFGHPDAFRGATVAANANDDALLLQYVLEAMRFRSPAAILLRYSTQDYVVAKSTDHGKKVPAGRLVIASNASAMMDDTELDNPKGFRIGRPSPHYLHFGFGIHECFGKYISQTQVTELVKHLLRLPNLRRSPGAAGQLILTGIYPTSFTVQWGA